MTYESFICRAADNPDPITCIMLS